MTKTSGDNNQLASELETMLLFCKIQLDDTQFKGMVSLLQKRDEARLAGKTTSDNNLRKRLKIFQDYTASWGYPMDQKAHVTGLEIAVKDIEVLLDQSYLRGITDTIDRMVAMTSSKPFGQWKPADVSAFFEALGDLEREVKQAAATPADKEADK